MRVYNILIHQPHSGNVSRSVALRILKHCMVFNYSGDKKHLHITLTVPSLFKKHIQSHYSNLTLSDINGEIKGKLI